MAKPRARRRPDWDYGPARAYASPLGRHWVLARPPRAGEAIQQPVTRTVTLDDAGRWSCDCEAGTFRKSCAHVRHIQETTAMIEDIRRIQEQLAAPFPVEALGWKPQTISGNRALAVPYIDARDVQQRLDDVLGVAGWEDAYEVLLDGNVVCRLRCKLGETWVTKCDVGGQSDQPDEGDRRKSGFSDALKRAAVKYGIGRYLYGFPAQWVDYDPQKRQLVGTPRVPAWAVPQPPGPADGR